MGEKRKKLSSVLTGCLTPESVKVVAESVGVSDLPDVVLTYIADEMTFRLRHTVQVGLQHLLCYDSQASNCYNESR